MSEEQHGGSHPKKPSNIEELRRLKQAKKEAKKKLNSKPQVEQSPPGKVYQRSFATVPDQPVLAKNSGEMCVMTFNVSHNEAWMMMMMMAVYVLTRT